MTEATETWTAEQVVYQGTRMGQGGKLAHKFAVLGENDEMQAIDGLFIIKGRAAYAVGGIYTMEIERAEDGSVARIRTSTMRYLRPYPDTGEIAVMRAQHAIARDEDAARRAEAKYKEAADVPESLDGMAKVYGKLPWGDKAAFDNVILMAVHRRAAELKRK